MTKYFDEHIRKVPRRQQPPNDNIIITDANNSVKEYICSKCNCIIRTRIAEDELYCNHCNSTIIIKDTRKKSKLEVPREHNNEVFVNYPPDPVSRFTKKGPEFKGGFKALRDRGVHFTSYHDSSEGKENAD